MYKRFACSSLIARLMPLCLVLALLLSCVVAAPAEAARVNKICAVVNGKAITMFDLQRNALPEIQRARLNPDSAKDKEKVDAILRMTEYNRFTKGIFGWVGFKTKWMEYENIERAHGETKWSFWKLFLYAIDGITAFSTVPLALASIMGVVFCIVAFLLIFIIVVKTLLFGDPVGGWPSMVCIMCMVSGVQLLCLGIVGQYLSKTYMEVKRRPIYLVKEEI